MRVNIIDVHPRSALRADESREEDFRQWRKTSQAKEVELHETVRITCSMSVPTKVHRDFFAAVLHRSWGCQKILYDFASQLTPHPHPEPTAWGLFTTRKELPMSSVAKSIVEPRKRVRETASTMTRACVTAGCSNS